MVLGLGLGKEWSIVFYLFIYYFIQAKFGYNWYWIAPQCYYTEVIGQAGLGLPKGDKHRKKIYQFLFNIF